MRNENSPQKLIALKKARTTKLVISPVLRHEACVLFKMRGKCVTTAESFSAPNSRMSTDHSSIPKLYAWGKSKWYEYLAIELLGPCIEIDGKTSL